MFREATLDGYHAAIALLGILQNASPLPGISLELCEYLICFLAFELRGARARSPFSFLLLPLQTLCLHQALMSLVPEPALASESSSASELLLASEPSVVASVSLASSESEPFLEALFSRGELIYDSWIVFNWSESGVGG
jgi:hypothetical protein